VLVDREQNAVVTVAEQAALALADTAVSVTALCPALVRSGMSEVGDDPAEVAEDALGAAARGEFIVLPDEWREAVRARGGRLASGRLPELPRPR
jgi:NAD(P)-dependent dehydrogenase (short-subunit alcohol dehydrogenase family)